MEQSTHISLTTDGSNGLKPEKMPFKRDSHFMMRLSISGFVNRLTACGFVNRLTACGFVNTDSLRVCQQTDSLQFTLLNTSNSREYNTEFMWKCQILTGKYF